MSSSKVAPLPPGMAELTVSSLENRPGTVEPPPAEPSKAGSSSKPKWWRRGVLGFFLSVILFPFWLVWMVLRTAAFVVLLPFGGWRKKESKAVEGHGEFEKKLQSLTSEEAAVHTRMRRRSQQWQALSRSLVGYMCIIEFLALVLAGMLLRSMHPPELHSGSDDPFTMSPEALRHLATRWLIFLSPILLIPGAALLLYSSASQLTHSRDKKDRKLLEDLEAKRRTQLEELKKQTNFYATLQLIQKFELPPVAELKPNAVSSGTQKGPKGPKRPGAGPLKGNTRGAPAAAAGWELQLTDGPGRGGAGGPSGSTGAPGTPSSEAFSSAGGDAAYGVPAAGGELRQRRSRRASIGGEWEMSPEKGVWTAPGDAAGAEEGVSDAGILITRRRSADNEGAGPSGSRDPWGDAGESELGGARGLGHGVGAGARPATPEQAGADGGGSDGWEEEENDQRQGDGGRWRVQAEQGKPGLLRKWAQGEGFLSRLAGLLVGEDPRQCYALICKRCYTHNGLARPEDFEFVSYICPRCHFFNPAVGPSAQQQQQQQKQLGQKDEDSQRSERRKQEAHETRQETQQPEQVEEPEQRSQLSGASGAKLMVQADQARRTTTGEERGEVEEKPQGIGPSRVALETEGEAADLQDRGTVPPPAARSHDDEAMPQKHGVEGGDGNRLQARWGAGDVGAGKMDVISAETKHNDTDEEDMFEMVLSGDLEPDSVAKTSLLKAGHGAPGAGKVRDSGEAAEVLSSEAPSEPVQSKGLKDEAPLDPSTAGSKTGYAGGIIAKRQTTAPCSPQHERDSVGPATEADEARPDAPDGMAGGQPGFEGEGKDVEAVAGEGAATGAGPGNEEGAWTGEGSGTEEGARRGEGLGQSSSVPDGGHPSEIPSEELHSEQAGSPRAEEVKGELDDIGDGAKEAEAAEGDGANSAPGTQSPSMLRSVIQKMSSRKGRSFSQSESTGSVSSQDIPEDGQGSAALGKKGRRSSGRRSRRLLA